MSPPMDVSMTVSAFVNITLADTRSHQGGSMAIAAASPTVSRRFAAGKPTGSRLRPRKRVGKPPKAPAALAPIKVGLVVALRLLIPCSAAAAEGLLPASQRMPQANKGTSASMTLMTSHRQTALVVTHRQILARQMNLATMVWEHVVAYGL
eukprot:831737-Prymnesium_polylepis.1